MKYYIKNDLSRSGKKITDPKIVDIKELDNSFYQKLTSEDEVYIYGGDGTINCFINKCIIYPKIIVVPRGTGNDLARSLTTNYKDVSIFSANGCKYVNGFDVGFGALVCDFVEKDQNKNKFTYVKNIYKALKYTKMLNIKVTIDGEVKEYPNTFLIACQNTEYFGGGMKVTPKAKIESDEVEICIIGNASKYLIATVFPTIFVTLHTKLTKYVRVSHAQGLIIELEEPYIAECDGEVQKAQNKYVIEHVGQIKIKLAK